MANILPSLPRSVPVSKWGQKINKHCTSDYWAEDKSAWFDRSLLPASLLPFSPFPSPPLVLLPLLLQPILTSFLSFFPSCTPPHAIRPSFPPSISPSPLLNTHPSHSPSLPPLLASSCSSSIFVSLLSLPPLFYFSCGASKHVGLK